MRQQESVQQIAVRMRRLLEKSGLVERDMENAWLTTDGSGFTMSPVRRTGLRTRAGLNVLRVG